MLVSEHRVFLVLLLRVNIVTIPIDNVIFVNLAKKVESVNLIFNNFFSAAGLQELRPSLIDNQ